MTNYVWITTQKEMFHAYPMAPKGVEFLKSLHRHIFKFKVYIEVEHNDRDIEFILFKRFINGIINKMDTDLEIKSCEMISEYLYGYISTKYPKRDIKIEVSEDGENGSEYYFSKSQSLYSG